MSTFYSAIGGERQEQLMETHETVRKMTDGQRGDIVATMAGAIPPNLTFEEAQAIIGRKGPLVAEIRAAFAKRRINAVPADDEWFELYVDNDADPMRVVVTDRYNPAGWKYLGPKLSGKRMLRAKLIRFEFVRNLKKAREKADEMGYRLVEGQAKNPFRAKFPKPDGQSPVIFGGSEWQDPDGNANVMCLIDFLDEWGPRFFWSDGGFVDGCRWLVVDKVTLKHLET